MSKTPPAAPIDYESDWRTYDRWAQEDQFWYENQKEKYGDPVEVKANIEEKMRSQGISEESNLWTNRVNEAVGGIYDYESEWQNRQKRLNSSLLYERLFESDAAPAHNTVAVEWEPGQSLDGHIVKGVEGKKQWYIENYGSVAPDNIYAPSDIEQERISAQARAKGAAGGSASAVEETRWI